MLYRVKNRMQPTITARDNLLSGRDVPKKIYSGGWFPPVDTPLTYGGPYAMPNVQADYGGANGANTVPPPNYPPTAPKSNAAHISFVELDGNQAYKQALAWWVTNDTRYADNALRIIDGWATTNKQWGIINRNGPLEAGWGIASMSKALELLRFKQWAGYTQRGQAVYNRFTSWVNTVMLPQMDHYVDQQTPNAIANNDQNVLGNWHSTIADAYISFGFLTENRNRYNKGKDLFMRTVTDYFRWGKGNWTKGPPETTRMIGECSETLRDLYHTQFGMGGLLNVAEMCWQQDEDLYKYNDCALAAGMEMHARIVNSVTGSGGRNQSYLPPGFKYIENAPKPPDGCEWRWDGKVQRLVAYNKSTNQKVGELKDGVKYVRDISHNPGGWEIGYNHYVGRLGMDMPETQILLQRKWPDWYDFHWGQGTLTHGDTAQYLWRNGVNTSTICQASVKSSAVKK